MFLVTIYLIWSVCVLPKVLNTNVKQTKEYSCIMHGVTWFKWMLPLLYWGIESSKRWICFFEQQWISPTVLWVEGWFYWSCLESLRHLQSESSWTNWAGRSKMASSTCPVVGARAPWFSSCRFHPRSPKHQFLCFCFSFSPFFPLLFFFLQPLVPHDACNIYI